MAKKEVVISLGQALQGKRVNYPFSKLKRSVSPATYKRIHEGKAARVPVRVSILGNFISLTGTAEIRRSPRLKRGR